MLRSVNKEPPLVKAIFKNDPTAVKLHLSSKEVNYQDADGCSPLHSAAYMGNREIVAQLLFASARANKKDTFRWLTPLHCACLKDNYDVAELLLSHEAPANERDRNFQTPLHYCASHNAIRCLELLIPAVNDLNVSDRQGRTALQHAALNGYTEIVHLLISNGAQVNSVDKQGRRAIHWAAHGGYVDVIRMLIEAGAEVFARDKHTWTVLHFAAAGNCQDLMEELLTTQKLSERINVLNKAGDAPLHVAAYNGSVNCVSLLLEFGADVNSRNNSDMTPLHFAAMSADSESNIVTLVKQGADVNACTKPGKTPLHYIATYGRIHYARLLIENGARVDVPDKVGNSALHVASLHAHTPLIMLLIQHGANINRHGRYKITPLHLACYADHEESVRILLENGADVNMKDKFGRTCLHFAALSKRSNAASLKLLLSRGANPYTLDNFGRSPLHYACLKDNYAVSLALLKRINEVSIVDCDGRTPLHYAAALDEHQGCIDLLLEKQPNCLYPDKLNALPLHYACAHGNLSSVESLIRAHVNAASLKSIFSDSNFYIASPLHIAAHYGHSDLIDTLCAFTDRIDFFNTFGNTPLHLAAVHGHFKFIMSCLQHDASVVVKDNRGRNALHLAAGFGKPTCLQLLVAEGTKGPNFQQVINSVDKNNRTPLMYAVSSKEEGASAYLLNLGANVSALDNNGSSALHRAASIGCEVSSCRILAHDSDVLLQERHGLTALHLAARQGSVTLLKALLRLVPKNKTSHECIVDKRGFTPLHLACYYGHESCVDALTNVDLTKQLAGSPFSAVHCACANGNILCYQWVDSCHGRKVVSLLDDNKRTPLHIAAIVGHVQLCRMLLETKGVDVNAQDSMGRTPLAGAVQKGHTEIVDMLIKNGANCELTDRHRNSILHLACRKNNESMTSILLENSGCVKLIDKQNKQLKTALHYAVSNGMVMAVEKLLLKGASIHIPDENDITAVFACASNQNSSDCLALILCLLFPDKSDSIIPRGSWESRRSEIQCRDSIQLKKECKESMSTQSSDSEYY